MTEINFTESGFWASQWWYNIPPIGGPPNEFDFRWDAINGALNVAVSGVHFGRFLIDFGSQFAPKC